MKKRIVALIVFLCLIFALCPSALASNEPVRIAIIDTGIKTSAIGSNHIIAGYNYVLPGSDTEDLIGHGTAISGIIVGSTSAGITGIAPNALLVPLVWQSKNEIGQTVAGNSETAAQAIYDAIDIYKCRIINISAGTEHDNAKLRAAVEYAEEQGVLIVSTAGNSGDSTVYYPGGYDTVLCVGAMEKDGESVASFSNSNSCVDVVAPGESIRAVSIKGTATRATGTSFSAAYVTATAAAMLEKNPSLTPAEIRTIIRSTATDIEKSGHDSDSGWGILNTEKAISWAQTGQIFRDVPSSAKYSSAVAWALENGITGGTTQVTFSPNMTCTRGQVVTFLWRAAGEPQPSSVTTKFTDVKSTDYFATAVSWAVENGITTGTSETTFSPNESCTEGQILTFLWRAMGSQGADNLQLNSPYYATAVSWASTLGLLDVSDFSPTEISPRSSIVSYLYACRAMLDS
jgi:hypothetical protein